MNVLPQNCWSKIFWVCHRLSCRQAPGIRYKINGISPYGFHSEFRFIQFTHWTSWSRILWRRTKLLKEEQHSASLIFSVFLVHKITGCCQAYSLEATVQFQVCNFWRGSAGQLSGVSSDSLFTSGTSMAVVFKINLRCLRFTFLLIHLCYFIIICFIRFFADIQDVKWDYFHTFPYITSKSTFNDGKMKVHKVSLMVIFVSCSITNVSKQ